MAENEGFAPIVAKNAKILIVGTMPGSASLLKQQYYGHPRNAFWLIMAVLFDAKTDYCYERRKEILLENGIAVWDVLQRCHRTGSLDADITMASIKTNNFLDFFTNYNEITHVFFNGLLAEKIYKKYVIHDVNKINTNIYYQRLPSTSPAYASLTLEQKTQAWKVIERSMVK
jgi:hypoxanthine-DNA glycosylase